MNLRCGTLKRGKCCSISYLREAISTESLLPPFSISYKYTVEGNTFVRRTLEMGIREIEIAPENMLVIHEMEDVCVSAAGRVRDSSMVLSRWMSTDAQKNYDFNGKTVLDLGAGTGLPGLTAARLGSARVILMDIEPLIPVLKKNLEVNGLEDRVEVCQLDWELKLPVRLTELSPVDLVLLSDVFLEEVNTTLLAKTLKEVCGKDTTMWVASQERQRTNNRLNYLANRLGRRVDQVWQMILPTD